MKYLRLMLIGFTLMLFMVACTDGNEDHQEADRETQDEVQTRLQEQVPVPEIDGAAARVAIGRHLERWQDENVVSYVSMFADNGRPIGYYVAQGKVASTCQMMSAPDRRDDDWEGDVLRAAPALDGTYYGENVNCGKFFFTADSDAYVEIHGGIQVITDQPLEEDLQPLDVEVQGLD